MNETYFKVFLNGFFWSLLFRYQKRVNRTNWRLSILFQIDLKVIRTMKSKNFSLGFTENISKFVILRRDIGKIKNLYKFCRVGLNV